MLARFSCMTVLQLLLALCLENSQILHGLPLAPKEKQILHLGNGSEPRELDPGTSIGSPAGRILDNLFEGLTQLHPLTLKPLPGVAESWDVSKDGLVYTFKIRKDARWSDGKPIFAEEFVHSWIRVLAPQTASEYAYQLYCIENGQAFNQGVIKDSSKLGIKALNKHTLQVTLNRPTAYFLQLTAFHTLYPTPSHVIAKYPDKEWTKAGKMVSNGAFKLLSWELNHFIKIVANEHYWDAEKVLLHQVVFHPIENLDTEEKAFQAGKLHQTYDVSLMKVPSYQREAQRAKGSYHPYRSDPFLASYFYRFNTKRKPFDDIRVRKALSLTVDRKLLVDRVTRRGEIPASSYTPPNISGYSHPGKLNISVTPQSVKDAQELLAQAGYPGGKNFPHTEILYNTSDNHKKIALALQQMWKKYLGISVGLINQEWKVFLNSQHSMNFSIARAGWVGDYPDPNTFLDMFVSSGAQNETGWSNKSYDSFIEKASKAQKPKLRFEAFEKAESILLEELPILPLYIYTKAQLTSPKLKMLDSSGGVIAWRPNISARQFLKHHVLVL